MSVYDVKCPTCGGPMTSRKHGATGQRFWGCNAYPSCRGTRNTDGEAPRRLREDVEIPDASADDLPSDRARRNDRARWRS